MKKLTALLLIFALLLALSACASPQNEKTEDGSGKTEETDKTEAAATR